MKIIKNRGFNLIELLIVIAIVSLISAISMPALINFQKNQAIKNTRENIVSVLNKAKSNTLASLNSSSYGVHFESNYIIYFMGESFSISDPNNEQINFESGVRIKPIGGINLNTMGNDTIFPRLTGDVIGYGTITIELTDQTTTQKIITINKTGYITSN